MKRASLKSMKVSVLASPSQDVTDRLLKGEAKAPTAAAGKSAASPKAAKASRTRKTTPAKPTTAPAQLLPASETTVVEDVLGQALAQARRALEALNAARDSTEARYNLGIRYRLDSLAHHLEQVTQFVTSQTL